MIIRELHLTTRCNSNCRFCLKSTITVPKEDMDFSIIERIPFDKIKLVNFTGHRLEPTLYPRFMDVVKLLKKHNIPFWLYSNTSTHNPDWWEELGRISSYNKNNRLIGTIDGINEIHEGYRVGTKFKKVVENFQSFNKAGGRSFCNTILFDKNENQINDIKKLAHNIGCIEHRVKTSWGYDQEYNRPKSVDIFIRKERSYENKDLPLDCEHLRAVKDKDLLGFILDIKGRYIPCCHIYQQLETDICGELTDLFNKCKNELYTIEGLMSSKFYRYIMNNKERLEICNRRCRNVRCDSLYINEKNKHIHKNNILDVWKDYGKSYDISLTDMVKVNKKYPGFNFIRYMNIWEDLYPDVIKCIATWKDKTPFNYSQYLSKKAIINQLKNYDFKNITIIGSWTGLLARMIHDNFTCSITTVDKDISMGDIDAFLNRDYKLHLHLPLDVKTLDVDNSDVVINTSCEHMNNKWFHRTVSGQLLILQSTNRSEPDHINTIKNLEEMKKKYPMTVHFEKEISVWNDDNKRFMLVGRK